MKSVSIKDDKNTVLVKVSHKKGEYIFERFAPGLGHLYVLIVTDNNERVKIGPKR